MKKHLYLVCGGALAGLTLLHCSTLAETAKPNSTAAAPASSPALLKTSGQSSKTVVEHCEDEWRANQETMTKLDMTEYSFIEQCSVKDDVPAASLGTEDECRSVARTK